MSHRIELKSYLLRPIRIAIFVALQQVSIDGVLRSTSWLQSLLWLLDSRVFLGRHV